MRRNTYRLYIFISQVAIVGALGVAALWNLASLLFDFPDPGWLGLLAPLPGLLMWGITLALPKILSGATPLSDTAYRLVYDSPEGWSDEQARSALLTLAGQAGWLEIIWARDTQGSGCWLNVPQGYRAVLPRLVDDIFPGGRVEQEKLPFMRGGVTILRLKKGKSLPLPSALCEADGIEGVYFRWQNRDTAVVSLWGDGAPALALEYAKKGDLLRGEGEALRRPRFSGQTPWPELPEFPSSKGNPGLGAVSQFERLAPGLRVAGAGLILGWDAGGEKVGFSFPDLPGARVVWALGDSAPQLVAQLAYQGIRAGLPVCVLDGDGDVVALLNRLAMRELALQEALLCDLERPAQSRLRLNPLWLPVNADEWPFVLQIWREWLKELGVTSVGLGRDAYMHTLIAVSLTAKAAIERGLTFDPPGLQQALESPGFLTELEHNGAGALFSAEDWEWWQTQGRKAPEFDVHLRLGHLRDRLGALLELPEYRVLWRPPYLSLPEAFSERRALFWRLPEQGGGRRRVYTTSLLMSLSAALGTYARSRPVLIFLHNLDSGSWGERLHQSPAARLFLSGKTAGGLPRRPKPQTLAVSRLGKADAEWLYPRLPGVRVADLRRLPAGRLVIRRGKSVGTADMKGM